MIKREMYTDVQWASMHPEDFVNKDSEKLRLYLEKILPGYVNISRCYIHPENCYPIVWLDINVTHLSVDQITADLEECNLPDIIGYRYGDECDHGNNDISYSLFMPDTIPEPKGIVFEVK